jgi:hypothetical protein
MKCTGAVAAAVTIMCQLTGLLILPLSAWASTITQPRTDSKTMIGLSEAVIIGRITEISDGSKHDCGDLVSITVEKPYRGPYPQGSAVAFLSDVKDVRVGGVYLFILLESVCSGLIILDISIGR